MEIKTARLIIKECEENEIDIVATASEDSSATKLFGSLSTSDLMYLAEQKDDLIELISKIQETIENLLCKVYHIEPN